MKSSFSIFPGLFLALVLPINTPISVLFFGSIMATVVGKMLFGGFGNNVFNPALIGYLFVMLIYGPMIAELGGYLNALEWMLLQQQHLCLILLQLKVLELMILL